MVKENFLKLAAMIGLNPNHVETLATKEADEIDFESISNDFNTTKKTVIKRELEDDFKKRLGVEYGKSVIKFMKDVNKNLDLGFSSTDLEKKKLEDFMAESKTIISERSTQSNEGEDSEYKTKYNDMVKKFDELKESYDTKIDNLTKTHSKEVEKLTTEKQSYIIDREFNEVFKDIEFGISKAHLDVWKKQIKSDILEKYKVLENGGITGLDDESAVNFTEDASYTHLSQPVKYLVDKYELGKKSGGRNVVRNSEGADGPTDGKGEAYSKLHANLVQASKGV